jgi:GNAT superfamily N-acetyltransferase
MSRTEYVIVRANSTEVDAIRVMQARSMRALGRAHYSEEAIERFLRAPGTLDDMVVAEGHYFVVRDKHSRIIGSGGWSQLRPNYTQPGIGWVLPRDKALVRGVFVDPDVARQGIGTAIMQHLEIDGARAGVASLALTATLSGVPLYGLMGYLMVRPHAIVLSDGVKFRVADMEKSLLAAKAA